MATSQAEIEEKPEAQADEKADGTTETAVKEEHPKAAAEQNIEEKAQDQQAAAEKPDSKESDTAPESDSEQSEPQEPIAENTAPEQAPAEENTEQTVETDKAESPEQVDGANENAVNRQLETATDENAAGIDADASDKVIEEKVVTTEETKDQPISETIQRMTQSPATLPGEPATPPQPQTPPVSDAWVPSSICAKDIMQQNTIWANADDSVQQALAKIQQHDIAYIMIGRDGMLDGIVSKSDLTGAISPYLKPVFAKWRRPLDDATLQIKVKWIMSRPVQTISPETSLKVIIENMRQSHRRALPVVDEQGKVQGLVTVFDIFNALPNSYQNPSIPE